MSKKNSPSKEAVTKLKSYLAENLQDLQYDISICLSDLPKEKMQKATNGKIYVNLSIGIRKEPDNWGRDLKVYVTPNREDRELHAVKCYVGGGKMIIFASNVGGEVSNADVASIIPQSNNDEKDDLPF